MTELNIKKEIGRRILEARKAKGITLKVLGELTGGLKQTRLTNWEQGVRSPGPEEIKQLAQALSVSPAYLMCLSDERQFDDIKNPSQLVPLLDYRQACEVKLHATTVHEQDTFDDIAFISLSTALLPNLSPYAFALKITNDSMIPEIRVNDILVIDPIVSPRPGSIVVVKITDNEEVIVCQYRKLSYTSHEFDLITLNENWPDIRVNDSVNIKILGSMVQNIRTC